VGGFSKTVVLLINAKNADINRIFGTNNAVIIDFLPSPEYNKYHKRE